MLSSPPYTRYRKTELPAEGHANVSAELSVAEHSETAERRADYDGALAPSRGHSPMKKLLDLQCAGLPELFAH